MKGQHMKRIDDREAYEAVRRLFKVAAQDTGQARRVADFLLAWHNAAENGGWAPVDLWSVDTAIADDMLLVLGLIRESSPRYPGDMGFRKEIQAVWEAWRSNRQPVGS